MACNQNQFIKTIPQNAFPTLILPTDDNELQNLSIQQQTCL
jgi:hypothetical protein